MNDAVAHAASDTPFAPGPAALVFAGAKGSPLRRSNFNRMTGWTRAVESIGAPGLHLSSRPGARFRCCHRPVSNK